MKRDTDQEAESRRIIRRVDAESDASMMQRARNHMTGRDKDKTDAIELWGTRIGRWLGLALLIYLVWWLIDFTATGG